MISLIEPIQLQDSLGDDGILFVRNNSIFDTMVKIPLLVASMIIVAALLPIQSSFSSPRDLDLIIYPDGSTHISTEIDVDPFLTDYEVDLFGSTIDNLVVLGASSVHYCISRSLSIMGMGSNSFIPIPVDNEEKCIMDELYKVYEKVVKEGKKVMAIVANACATSTGLFDPINEMAEFCSKKNVWFHVDAAHGAVALLSKKEKQKVYNCATREVPVDFKFKKDVAT